MHKCTDVQAEAEAALQRQAVRTMAALIKDRARAYAKSPKLLDALFPRLSLAEPETLIAAARFLLKTEKRSPRRWLGVGGEIPKINAKAALLYGRMLRRKS